MTSKVKPGRKRRAESNFAALLVFTDPGGPQDWIIFENYMAWSIRLPQNEVDLPYSWRCWKPAVPDVSRGIAPWQELAPVSMGAPAGNRTLNQLKQASTLSPSLLQTLSVTACYSLAVQLIFPYSGSKVDLVSSCLSCLFLEKMQIQSQTQIIKRSDKIQYLFLMFSSHSKNHSSTNTHLSLEVEHCISALQIFTDSQKLSKPLYQSSVIAVYWQLWKIRYPCMKANA